MVHARAGRPAAPGRAAASSAALRVRPRPCTAISHAPGTGVYAHAPRCACASSDGTGALHEARRHCDGVHKPPGDLRLPLTALPR